MGLLSAIAGLPLAPLRGTVAIAEQIRRQAEEEFYDPATIRAELENVDRMRETGALSDDEATYWEDVLLDRLMTGRERAREE
jgi:gluconate kinase